MTDNDNRLKTVFDAAVSGAILIVVLVVGFIIFKLASALGVVSENDSGSSGDPDTDFGEGPIHSGEFFEGPIW